MWQLINTTPVYILVCFLSVKVSLELPYLESTQYPWVSVRRNICSLQILLFYFV